MALASQVPFREYVRWLHSIDPVFVHDIARLSDLTHATAEAAKPLYLRKHDPAAASPAYQR